ncbi:MAG TPA: YkgJ family cysteine cluster protein [Oscillatoriaceae cyanobacterium]
MAENPQASSDLLRATLTQIAQNITRADNVGESDDARDLYYLIDYMSFAVKQTYPQIPCFKGCSHCCRKYVFRVTELEWRRVRAGLDALAPEVRAETLARNRRLYGHRREELEAAGRAWSSGETITRELTEDCPMLVGGRCSVYDDRPAICRAYGYSSAEVNGVAKLLICKEETEEWFRQMEAPDVPPFPMPRWNPIHRKLEALNGIAAIKPLPLWLLELEEAEAAPSA